MANMVFLIFVFTIVVNRAAIGDDKNISGDKSDGRVLNEIFVDSHIAATKRVETKNETVVSRQKQLLIHSNLGYIRSAKLSVGAGIEFKVAKLILPITLVCKYDQSINKKNNLFSLGTSLHWPGNLFSSNFGCGIAKNFYNKNQFETYGIVGVELANFVFSEYQWIYNTPDLLRAGLRFYY